MAAARVSAAKHDVGDSKPAEGCGTPLGGGLGDNGFVEGYVGHEGFPMPSPVGFDVQKGRCRGMTGAFAPVDDRYLSSKTGLPSAVLMSVLTSLRIRVTTFSGIGM